jgi:hypothetical protein
MRSPPLNVRADLAASRGGDNKFQLDADEPAEIHNVALQHLRWGKNWLISMQS